MKNKAAQKRGKMKLEKTPKKMGAPSKYKPDYCKRIVDFFSVEPYRLVETERMEEHFKNGTLKKKLVRKRPMPNKLPTLFRFADSIKVDVSTLDNWCKSYPDFFRAFTRAKEMQKEFLISLGLAGVTPPAAFAFVASNITDMRSRGIMSDDLNPGDYVIPVIIRRGLDDTRQRLPEPQGPKKVKVTVLNHGAEKTGE